MTENLNPARQVGGGRSYHAPVLTVHGTVEEITQAVGNKLNTDGGTNPTGKTSA